MAIKQHVHHKKPGGKMTLNGSYTAVSGLGTFKASGGGCMKAELYVNVTYEDDPRFPGGGIIEARVLRKKWKGKWAPVDPCGADGRSLPPKLGQAFFRFKVNEPIRSGETGRTYYWQIRVRGVKKAVLTTRYDDFWREV